MRCFIRKILFFSLMFVVLSAQACGKSAPPASTGGKSAEQRIQPLVLNYWRVFDEKDDFDEILEEYRASFPHIEIRYRKLRFEEYEQELLDALAEDRGPDVFSIHNTWMRGYKNKLLPMPSSVIMPFQKIIGTLQKEIVTELTTIPSINLRTLKDRYVDVVYDDVVMTDVVKKDNRETAQNNIYGLPLSVDSLALFYNRDLLNNAGIANPATTWQEFQDHVKKMSRVDRQNNILLSGAALGTSENIPRSTDILSLVMMQNGTQMTNDDGYATFHLIPENLREREVAPGVEALLFYTDFANPTKVVYTWNKDQKNALDAFIEGNVAYFFGYSYNIETVKARAPKLNFDIASIPQIPENPVMNYANYWVETVSKKTRYPDEAWHFVQFLAKPENVEKYLKRSGKPTGHKALIDKQKDDLVVGVFANQVLTAKSWYKGVDAAAAETILRMMIDQVLLGNREINDIINTAASQINQTIGGQ